MCVNLDYEALSENVIFSEADCLVFHGVYIQPGSQLPMDGLCQRETQFLFFFFYGGELRGTQRPPKMHFPASQSPANRPQPLGDTAVEKHNFNRILKSSCCILLGQFLSLLFQNNYTILTPSSSLVEQFRQTFVTMCSNSLILTFCVATI